MVLAGCSNPSRPVEKVENNPSGMMAEDNLAHEELFGGSKIAVPTIKRMSEIDTKPSYKVGYQIHYESNELSIRFVAAINSDYTTMRWSRGLTTGHGTEVKAFTSQKSAEPEAYFDSTVVYTSLSNGGEDVMEAGKGEYEDYTGFIVYSLTNIPYSTYEDCYLGVSLSLDGASTPFYAVKVKRNGAGTASSDTFSFSKDKSGFFLAGTITGRNRTVNSDSSFKGDNAAAFDTDFNVDDSFLIIQKESNMFKVWDSRCITTDATYGTSRFFEDNNGRIRVKSGGDIRLFLNGSNELWSDAISPYARTGKGLYVRGFVTTGEDDWACKDGFELKSDRKDYAVLFHVYFHTGNFKIANSGWSEQYNYINGGDKTGNFEDGAGDGNANCLTAGYYDIYINTENPRQVYIFKSE